MLVHPRYQREDAQARSRVKQMNGFAADEPGVDGGDLAMIHAAATGEGLIPITADMFRELADAAQATKGRFDASFSEMTLEQAQFVRGLRVDDGYTWRAVASTCALEWSGDWGGNQIAGMAICERAAELCGDGDYMTGAWNE